MIKVINKATGKVYGELPITDSMREDHAMSYFGLMMSNNESSGKDRDGEIFYYKDIEVVEFMTKTVAEMITVGGSMGLSGLNQKFNSVISKYESQGYKVVSVVPYGDFSKIEVFIDFKIGYNVIFAKDE